MSGDLDFMFKPIVLVTGFGPYLDHPVNASWEGVKLINKDEIEEKHNVELVLLELPVTYENVDEFVPELWETYTPKLMIHVGVSRKADHFTLEKQAHRKGYQKPDYLDQIPANHTCTAEGAIRLHTKLNVEKICNDFNTENVPDSCKAVSSVDAGRYLCEYIYYTSLSFDNARTLFVHVPDIPTYPSEVTARGLERILALSLEQIREAEGTSEITDKMQQTNFADGDNNL